MALFSLADAARGALAAMSTAGMVGEGCTRGSGLGGYTGWVAGGLYRYTTQPAPRTHI